MSLFALNENCGAKAFQNFTIEIGETPPLGGFKLRVGRIELSADSLVRVAAANGFSPQSLSREQRITTQNQIEDGTYKAGGDTRINDYLRFNGTVVITLNKAAATLDLKVEQGRVYLTNIPLVGDYTLWEGGRTEFTIDGNGEITKLLQEQVAKPLQAAGLDIEVQSARLLLDDDLGIRILGKLTFPDVYGFTALSGEFDSLEISQQNGVRFAGQIHLADFELGGIGIRNVTLEWTPGADPTRDKFAGEGDLITPAFQLGVRVAIAGGFLDGIGADLNVSGTGIPVPPFLNITGCGLAVEGLQAPPFSIAGNVHITLLHPVMQNIISLDEVGLKYTSPSKLDLTGELRILTARAANAYLNLDLPSRFEFGGGIELIESFPVLIITADLAAGVSSDPVRFSVEGGATGALQIPAYENFPDGVKKAFPPLWLAQPLLPKTLLKASIAYRKNTFSTGINFGWPVGEIVFAVRHAAGQVQVLVGKNLDSLKKVIGLGSFDGTNLGDPAYQRAMLLSLHRDRDSLGGGPLVGDGLYIPAASLATAQTVGSVTVAPNTPRVFFSLFSEAGAPRYQLIKPDNSRLTPENPGGAHYQQSLETKETVYVVADPAAGEWRVEAEDASQGPFVLDAWGANAPPTITSLTAAQNGANVAINYNAADPDDTVTVALFYDTDSVGFDGSTLR